MIGGGTIGCYVAARLAALGNDVVIVEAGDLKVADGPARGYEPSMSSERYAGAFEGRGFGLGGTSALWGGVLIPFGGLDTSGASPETLATWTHIASVVTANALAVQRAIGITPEPDFESGAQAFLGSSRDRVEAVGLAACTSVMLPFSMRNFARLLPQARQNHSRCRVVINAVATAWGVQHRAGCVSIDSIEAVSVSGRNTRVRAKEFLIAAGAIESARILLEIDRATNERVLVGRRDVGRYLSDHLSTPIAAFRGADATRAISVFAQRFEGRVLRAIRFIDRDVLKRGRRHFVHVTFASANAGFQLAKKALSSLQARRVPRVSGNELLRGGGGLAALAYHRLVRKRLYISPDTPVGLQLDVEQEPRRSCGVSLRTDRDRYGRWNIDVSWNVSDAERAAMSEIQESVLAKWNALAGVLPSVERLALDGVYGKLHDTYHPVGTCRMGTDEGAVLNHELRVRGLANLRVISTAAFPTAGCANPTFSMLCFAEALVGSISRSTS